ncbi:hypothetical protein ACHQM5_013574 [Ranunculus cassubicifolius]
MWPKWGKSPGRPLSRAPSSNFTFSSFKDIQSLIQDDQQPSQEQQQKTPQIKKSPTIFHRVSFTKSLLRSWSCPIKPENIPDISNVATPKTISLPGTETRIVIYFTSLRIVRKTFEECKTVRFILRGFRVSIDERDLSMDAGFLEELQQILGLKKHEQLELPRVFIGGRYIGGVEEVRQLHETGELKKIVEGFPSVEPGVCDHCGGYRFVLCDQCNGSHKCFMDKGGFRSCLICNENGLIKCPSCTCAPP